MTRFLNIIGILLAVLLLALCVVSAAHSNPSQTVSGGCGVQTSGTASAATCQQNSQGQGQGQSQSNTQGQGQTQAAQGGNAQARGGQGGTGGSATGGQGGKSASGAISGASTGASTATTGPSVSAASTNTSTSTTDSGNFTYREAANTVSPATMIIQGCQVEGQAGGSNTRAAGMLGIGFTPAQCYDYMLAQAYNAIGARQAACEILNHTKAAERAIKAGAVLPDCAPIVSAAVATGADPRYVTQEQFDRAFRKSAQK